MRTAQFYIAIVTVFVTVLAGASSSNAQSSKIIQEKQLQIRKTTNDSVKTILYGDLAFEFLNINFDSAGYYAIQALQSAKNTSSKYVLADAFSVNGTIARYLGNFDEAVAYYQKCLKLRTELKDSTGMYKVLGNIGNAYNYIKSDGKMALEYYFKSLAIQKQLKAEKEMAVTSINISSIYISQQNYLKALHYVEEAQRLAEKFNDYQLMGKACLNIGELYLELDQHDKGEFYFLKSLKYRREAGDSTGVANTLNNLSALYEKTGDIKTALKMGWHTIKIREAIFDSVGLTTSLSNTALLYLRDKNPEKAHELVDRSLQISTTIGFAPGLATSQKVKGEIYLFTGQHEKAIPYCEKSYNYWKNTDDKHELNSSCKCLYEAHDHLNHDMLAYRYFKEYNQLDDSIRKAAQVSETIRQQTIHEFEKEQYEDSLNRAIREERKELQRIQNEKAASQKIYLQQWIILFSSLFFVLIIITILYTFRNNRARQKALYQQKITETELMALRAQMNPHFIFNCLSSIQNCVDKNEFENADKYLGKFSKLLRTSLNTSRKSFISLTEEINYLTLYMELEAMRMNDKFRFHFHVSPQINAAETLIPVMVIQPFIENAIKHGIAPLNKPGKIDIHIQKTGDFCEIKITDNGVGRTISAQHNKSRLKPDSHQSLGLEITRSRMQLLYPHLKNAVDINDLISTEGSALGTEVTLRIPNISEP